MIIFLQSLAIIVQGVRYHFPTKTFDEI